MNDTVLLKDIRARLSDHRYEHSLQVAKAVGEGCVAVLNAAKSL